MILLFAACFQINSGDFEHWKTKLIIDSYAQNEEPDIEVSDTGADSGEEEVDEEVDTSEDTGLDSGTAEETGMEFQDFEIEVSELPAGTFQMGCTDGDTTCFPEESPAHSVEITRAFAVMKTEVTQALYESVMLMNPSEPAFGGTFPVHHVSWYDALTFANTLSRLEGRQECYVLPSENNGVVEWIGFDCNGWRLLTEAEWEYAARGNEAFIYAGADSLEDIAWYRDNSDVQVRQVGTKNPNGFDLYDMNGNLWEWCWDWYGDYPTEPQTDPLGVSTGSLRIIRGGSFGTEAVEVGVSGRGRRSSTTQYGALGLRLGRTL